MFATWSIRNPVPSLLFFILLILLGLKGFSQLGIQKFPDMDLPTVNVSASLEGAAPEQLETEVAHKIEDKLASLSRLDHITTTITDGSVSIAVSFEMEKDVNEALNEVRNAVDTAMPDLPPAMHTPTVAKQTTEASALMTYTIASSRLNEQELSWFVDNDVSKALMKAQGVGAISRIGGIDREVRIELHPALMEGLGISATQVSSQLKSMAKDNSGGLGEIGGKRQSIRTIAAANSAADIAAITIPSGDGRQFRLDQIATIEDTFADRTSLAYRDGKPVIIFQLKRSKGFADVSVAENIRATMDSFRTQHPEVVIAEASETVTPIYENYKGSMHLLLEGAFLTMLVVWWFLRDVRGTLIAATALPLSIIPVFAVMHWLGFTLNTVSLLALALVIGILVDDAIVEIENIVRHIRDGKPIREAAMEAASEIGLAVIGTTLTLVAVFLPTAFMAGIPGIIFRQFGVTAAVAVLASLLVARLLTPMMAAYFMKAQHHPAGESRMMQRYLRWVQACLRHPGRTLAGVGLFFLLSMALIPFVKTGFFPAQDNGQTSVMLTLPPGSSLADTAKASQKAQALLSQVPEVAHVLAAVGTASSGGGMNVSSNANVASATLTVDMVDRDRRGKQAVVENKMRQVLEGLAGVRVAVGGGNSGEKLQITLASDDIPALEQAAKALEPDLRTLKNIGSVTSSAALQTPEIQIRPDYARAASLGVTSSDLADAVRLATYGAYSSELPKMNLPQRQVVLRVQFDPQTRTNLEAMKQIRVTGSQGSVALASLADIRYGSSVAQIDRIDRDRNVTLNVELAGRTVGEVMAEARKLPAMQALPPSVHQVQQGDLQRMSELFTSFGSAMAIGIFCIYAVLVLLFGDFIQPVTILAALPLSVGGALVALLATGQDFSMPSVIGLLMLMGIAVKNSILLVEYAIMAQRDHGMDRIAALVDACHKRARPIIMTTIAMGAGMAPIALGMGADPSFRQPMAIVVIGGLLTSTVLSLLVIPVIFVLMDNVEQWLTRRRH